MDKYIKKYRKIVDKLVEKSFPVLKGKKILVISGKTDKYYSAMSFDFIFLKLIIVYDRIKNLLDSSLRGIFAHELSHFEINKKKGFFGGIFYFFKWIFSSEIRKREEREADLMVIEKGYGKNYISFLNEMSRVYTKKQFEDRFKKGYLTVNEIKSYMKKFSK